MFITIYKCIDIPSIHFYYRILWALDCWGSATPRLSADSCRQKLRSSFHTATPNTTTPTAPTNTCAAAAYTKCASAIRRNTRLLAAHMPAVAANVTCTPMFGAHVPTSPVSGMSANCRRMYANEYTTRKSMLRQLAATKPRAPANP
eukprot:1195624-Prorocentrum_minimum.AAC.5